MPDSNNQAGALLLPDLAAPCNYAAVVVNIDAPGLNQPFTYRVPENINVEVGDAVVVPFGAGGDQIGHVVGVDVSLPEGLAPAKVKDIQAKIDGAESFDAEIWQIAEWVAEQTLSDLRDVIKLIAPTPSSAQIRTIYKLNPFLTLSKP